MKKFLKFLSSLVFGDSTESTVKTPILTNRGVYNSIMAECNLPKIVTAKLVTKHRIMCRGSNGYEYFKILGEIRKDGLAWIRRFGDGNAPKQQVELRIS
jgi:hypothetical protein